MLRSRERWFEELLTAINRLIDVVFEVVKFIFVVNVGLAHVGAVDVSPELTHGVVSLG